MRSRAHDDGGDWLRRYSYCSHLGLAVVTSTEGEELVTEGGASATYQSKACSRGVSVLQFRHRTGEAEDDAGCNYLIAV